jgi:hypothetical protein
VQGVEVLTGSRLFQAFLQFVGLLWLLALWL